VNVRLDDRTAENFGFGSVTDYRTVEPGGYQLRIVSAVVYSATSSVRTRTTRRSSTTSR